MRQGIHEEIKPTFLLNNDFCFIHYSLSVKMDIIKI